MNFFFSISYRTNVRRSIFGTQKVSLRIEEVIILSERGPALSLRDESIKVFRRCIANFIENEKTIAERVGEKVVFIGYDCCIQGLLLQQLINVETSDLQQEYMELANGMADEDFGLDSEYSIQKMKSPSRKYSLTDKLEMIFSHPEFPKDKGMPGEVINCLWVKCVYEFDLFRVFMMSKRFNEVVAAKQDIINNEK